MTNRFSITVSSKHRGFLPEPNVKQSINSHWCKIASYVLLIRSRGRGPHEMTSQRVLVKPQMMENNMERVMERCNFGRFHQPVFLNKKNYCFISHTDQASRSYTCRRQNLNVYKLLAALMHHKHIIKVTYVGQ